MEQSKTSILFLHVQVKRTHDNTIITDILYKTTDTKLYLNFNSCYPRATRTKKPFCLARRISIIIEDQHLRSKRLLELKDFLKNPTDIQRASLICALIFICSKS